MRDNFMYKLKLQVAKTDRLYPLLRCHMPLGGALRGDISENLHRSCQTPSEFSKPGFLLLAIRLR